MEAGLSPLDPARGSYFVSFLVELSNRPDLVAVVEAHKTTEGECSTVWFARPDDDTAFYLLLSFTSPIETKAVLSFDILRHGLIVDCLINGRGSIGLIPGTTGERLGEVLAETRGHIRIPVGATVPRERWDSLWVQAVARAIEISHEDAANLIALWRAEIRVRAINPDIPPFNQVTGVLIDEENNRVLFFTKDLLKNHLRRDGPEIAESFDRFFGEEIDELSEELSALMSATMPGLLRAARSGDQLIWTCGQLIGNSTESVVAAIELLRVGRRLQPGVLLRTAIEGAAMAAHLFHQPASLGRFLAGKINSASAVGEAKAVIPVIAQFWGYLSSQFAHLGQLYQSVQPSAEYESSDDPGAKTNLMAIHLAVNIVWMVAELVFFDSFSVHWYWTRVSPGQYALDIQPEMRSRMQEIADRLSLKDE